MNKKQEEKIETTVRNLYLLAGLYAKVKGDLILTMENKCVRRVMKIIKRTLKNE